MRERLAKGILAFPATPFDDQDALDAPALARHVADLVAYRPAALVPAGGAGELFSLSLSEHEILVRATVQAAQGIPVVAGVGGSLPTAMAMAQAAQEAGADAVLLLPPYLVGSEQAGLLAFIQSVCRSVAIGVIAYSRDNGVLSSETVRTLAAVCPNFLGVKDGTADVEVLTALALQPRNFVVIGGSPTAELMARQNFAIGIHSYSSAVFAFAPHVASRFFDAARTRDPIADQLMAELFLPLVALRKRKRGYAVSVVKGGLRAMGKPLGGVRPPLVDLSPEEVIELRTMVERAEALMAREARPSAAAAA